MACVIPSAAEVSRRASGPWSRPLLTVVLPAQLCKNPHHATLPFVPSIVNGLTGLLTVPALSLVVVAPSSVLEVLSLQLRMAAFHAQHCCPRKLATSSIALLIAK
jgi:hypothetical protein